MNITKNTTKRLVTKTVEVEESVPEYVLKLNQDEVDYLVIILGTISNFTNLEIFFNLVNFASERSKWLDAAGHQRHLGKFEIEAFNTPTMFVRSRK